MEILEKAKKLLEQLEAGPDVVGSIEFFEKMEQEGVLPKTKDDVLFELRYVKEQLSWQVGKEEPVEELIAPVFIEAKKLQGNAFHEIESSLYHPMTGTLPKVTRNDLENIFSSEETSAEIEKLAKECDIYLELVSRKAS